MRSTAVVPSNAFFGLKDLTCFRWTSGAMAGAAAGAAVGAAGSFATGILLFWNDDLALGHDQPLGRRFAI